MSVAVIPQPLADLNGASVRVGVLGDSPLPSVVTPAAAHVELAAWIGTHVEAIEAALLRSGGILFRGFGIDSAAALERAVSALPGETIDYSERSTPRSRVHRHVYTSTEYPADQEIPPHNENAYADVWPSRIWFACQTPATSGGATPIVDSRRVFAALDPAVRDRFISERVMYVRNYGRGAGLPWPVAFQTEDRSAVESHCRRHAIEWTWHGADHLTTRQVRDAVAAHPVTGEMVWFNQAHLFHVTGLPEPLRRSMLAVFKRPENLPRHAFYGTGEPIEPDALDHVRRVYASHAVQFPWQRGDLLLLDNVLAAHGRTAFTGPRRVLVSMTRCS